MPVEICSSVNFWHIKGETRYKGDYSCKSNKVEGLVKGGGVDKEGVFKKIQIGDKPNHFVAQVVSNLSQQHQCFSLYFEDISLIFVQLDLEDFWKIIIVPPSLYSLRESKGFRITLAKARPSNVAHHCLNG